MRDQAYETGSFEHKGRTYQYALHHDGDIGPPWKEHDGHGPVRETRENGTKFAGEWVLKSDRWGKTYYDFAEATKIGKRDGWGIGKDAEAELAQSLGRAPTRKEIVRAAVIRDFEYLRGWLNDDWHWAWIKVSHGDLFETLGGIQSDDDDVDHFKTELADQIADQLDDDMAAEITASRPDMQPDFHA